MLDVVDEVLAEHDDAVNTMEFSGDGDVEVGLLSG